MLADQSPEVQQGAFADDIQLPSSAKLEILRFIAAELPNWRDDPERADNAGETILTEQLCEYLQNAAYQSNDWSHINFRTETSDETDGRRKIDLTVKPLGAALIIENRRHTKYDSLFPIECKRLPTPDGKDRDEREYVTNEPKTTGGIYRFKFEHHGASHNFAAMIGYVQEQDFAHWKTQINDWILALAKDTPSKWSKKDTLDAEPNESQSETLTLQSNHPRPETLSDIELHHLWIAMN